MRRQPLLGSQLRAQRVFVLDWVLRIASQSDRGKIRNRLPKEDFYRLQATSRKFLRPLFIKRVILQDIDKLTRLYLCPDFILMSRLQSRCHLAFVRFFVVGFPTFDAPQVKPSATA